MAGERKGKLYEALTKLALDEIIEGRTNVFWNETPTGISIEPDISVGCGQERSLISNPHHPQRLVQEVWNEILAESW